MLPMGLKLADFAKVNKLIFTPLQFNIDDEITRDNKIFGIKIQSKKTSIKNKSNTQNTKKNKKKL
jgi:hypothetical protein